MFWVRRTWVSGKVFSREDLLGNKTNVHLLSWANNGSRTPVWVRCWDRKINTTHHSSFTQVFIGYHACCFFFLFKAFLLPCLCVLLISAQKVSRGYLDNLSHSLWSNLCYWSILVGNGKIEGEKCLWTTSPRSTSREIVCLLYRSNPTLSTKWKDQRQHAKGNSKLKEPLKCVLTCDY